MYCTILQFFTTKEFKEKFGLDVNVQRKVETPELYIIGRCRHNDEQLGYIETRVDCLKDLEKQLNISELDSSYDNNIMLKDCMRVFHGDGPASALEAGNRAVITFALVVTYTFVKLMIYHAAIIKNLGL